MQPERRSSPWHCTGVALYLLLLTLVTAAFFVAVWGSGRHEGPLNSLTEAVVLVIQCSAALLGLRQLSRARHVEAAPLRYFTLAVCGGLALDALGDLVWLSYNARGIPLPFPSAADVFYIASAGAWVVGLCLFFWALDTNVRDELGPFIDILGVTWSLIIVVLSLLGLSAESVGNLIKLTLDIVYPFFAALVCALLGAIILGPQLRRLCLPWRWFIIILYCGWLVTFFGDIGFGITSSLSRRNLSFELLYYDGGPIDAVYAAGDLLICWAVAFLPLGVALTGGSSPVDMAEFDLPEGNPIPRS